VDALVVAFDLDVVDVMAELTAHDRCVLGLYCAAGHGSGDLGAFSRTELVTWVHGDHRNAVPSGADRAHLVEASFRSTLACQNCQVDVAAQRARLVGLHSLAWPSMDVVAGDGCVTVAQQTMLQRVSDAWR
jgi:hypothetical protein